MVESPGLRSVSKQFANVSQQSCTRNRKFLQKVILNAAQCLNHSAKGPPIIGCCCITIGLEHLVIGDHNLYILDIPGSLQKRAILFLHARTRFTIIKMYTILKADSRRAKQAKIWTWGSA